MKYLLDTHAFLWSLFDQKQLTEKASNIIMDPDNSIYISLVSFWEIALKFNIGKLSLQNIMPEDLPGYAEKAGFEIFELSSGDVSSFYKLPKIKHKDPFDRLIIWQCIQNDITLISKDADLGDYIDHGLKITW